MDHCTLHCTEGRRKVWKSGGASSNEVGIICLPGWDRVNWSAKIWVCHGTPGTPRDDTPAFCALKIRMLALTLDICFCGFFAWSLVCPKLQIGLLTDFNKLLVVQRRWGKPPQNLRQRKARCEGSIWFYEHGKHLLPQNCLDGLRRLSHCTVWNFLLLMKKKGLKKLVKTSYTGWFIRNIRKNIAELVSFIFRKQKWILTRFNRWKYTFTFAFYLYWE